jgi:type I restriction enzyme M protein
LNRFPWLTLDRYLGSVYADTDSDAPWTNKDRLNDATLRELVEHFSSLDLSIANLPEDELGNGYEYLIKKFADDSGHTAAEFYTNRTVVHLMTELLEPQSGESIYDPTCGSGGMLLSAVAHLRRQNREWRNVRLYGQERNLMTSSIARMNCFLHGIEDFRIERGDTLSEPKLVQADGALMQFDVVLANPPYSIKQWDRAKFAGDPWGRNQFGTPPQGRADYAFWQHILASLLPSPVRGGGGTSSKRSGGEVGGGGRCAILFPHGVLFRQEEAEMRRKLIDADVIEAVIGLGPNLFYNSPMEACVVVCRAGKPKARRGKILFINAVNEVTRERAQSYLTDAHIERIVAAYRAFRDDAGFAHVATLEAIRAKDGNLSIPLYVPAQTTALRVAESREHYNAGDALQGALREWLDARRQAAEALRAILPDAPSQSIPSSGSGQALNEALILRASNVDPDKAQLKDAQFDVLADAALFDRAGWQRVTFGDVVRNVNETERDPQSAGIDRFIGLEHMEPGSLHIREWGNVADGTTFNRRCRPGQVLFGKRRAYQRKVAVAEFDAVVSGDIYVLAPKDERLLPELLPFICLSERFFQHAVGTSAGSLSPRTNWSSLANFAFDLPPLDQQRRIKELVERLDVTLEGYILFKAEILNAKKAIQNELLGEGGSDRPAKWQVTLADVTERISVGLATSTTDYYRSAGVPLLRNQNIRPYALDDADLLFIDPVFAGKYENKRVKAGDVITTRTGANIGQTCIVPEKYAGAHTFTTLIVTCDKELILPEYLVHHMNAAIGLKEIDRLSTTGGKGNLNVTAFAEYRIDLPPVSEQCIIISRLNSLDVAIEKLQHTIDSLKKLVAKLPDFLFGVQ